MANEVAQHIGGRGAGFEDRHFDVTARPSNGAVGWHRRERSAAGAVERCRHPRRSIDKDATDVASDLRRCDMQRAAAKSGHAKRAGRIPAWIMFGPIERRPLCVGGGDDNAFLLRRRGVCHMRQSGSTRAALPVEQRDDHGAALRSDWRCWAFFRVGFRGL
jgi:hypothetical protein